MLWLFSNFPVAGVIKFTADRVIVQSMMAWMQLWTN